MTALPERLEHRPIDSLTPYDRNARTHSAEQVSKIAASIAEYGFTNPILVGADGVIIAGHGRLQAARELGLTEVPVIELAHLDENQRRALVLADNRLALDAGWDDALLAAELAELEAAGFDLAATGFDEQEIEKLLAEAELGGEESDDEDDADEPATEGKKGNLADRFLLPPFSALNAREGWWQDRKRAWLALGIRSEEGRGDNALGFSDVANRMGKHCYSKETSAAAAAKGGYGKCLETGIGEKYGRDEMNGTSIFDPVLCELLYRWFSPLAGTVLDPFAGGSVRGIVAAKLGRRYVGHELRAEQVEANRAQAAEICADDDCPPAWICGDSRLIDKTCADLDADFVFSCPPYADLDVYSDDPQDLSTLNYDEFISAYREIIAKACARLKPNRFAAFVVGDVRDKKGNYYNFVGDTVEAFKAAGLNYYNEAVLVTAVGSLPIRAGKQFSASRKLGKTHQNVLVFVKGDGKTAAQACGVVDVEVGDVGGAEDPANKYGEVL